MPTIIEYALMAGASYISTRADINQFPVPKTAKGSETFSFELSH